MALYCIVLVYECYLDEIKPYPAPAIMTPFPIVELLTYVNMKV